MAEYHVDVQGRRFIAILFDNGNLKSVKERKIYQEGRPWERFYHAPYWHYKHHKLPQRATSIVVQIYTKAKEKHDEQLRKVTDRVSQV